MGSILFRAEPDAYFAEAVIALSRELHPNRIVDGTATVKSGK
ncbi:MAG: hypothetical protein ACREQ7_04715 [Candidatus Binatia bacterium]